MEFAGYPHFMDGIWKFTEIRSGNVYGALQSPRRVADRVPS